MSQRMLTPKSIIQADHLRMRFRPWINYSNMLAADDH
jgi:hypothetical protein